MIDVHTLSGAYAVDGLDDLERAGFERHLAECASCRAEVAGLRETATFLTSTSPATPPAALRARVLDQIAEVRPLPPLTDRHDARKSARLRTSRFLAAAAAIVVIGGGVVVAHPWSGSTSTAAQVLQASDAISATADLRTGGTVTVTRSRHLNRAVLVAHNIPRPPAGKTYELWLQDKTGTMHPAGLMSAGGDRTVVLDGDAAAATGAGITIEPAGGSQRPTTAPIALVGFGTT